MNILIFTKNWIGDVIFETPAIRAIRENFPEAHVIAVTTRRAVEILEANPCVDEVIPFDERGEEKSVFAVMKFIGRLRKNRIDKAFLFHRSATRARLAFLAGARERIGYDTKGRGSFLTRAAPEPEGPIHDVQYFLDLLRSAGLKVTGDYAYEFYFTEDDRRRAETLLSEFGLERERLIAINPGANWIPKRWPPAYFRELALRLAAQFGVQIVLTGSAEDEPVVREILEGAPSGAVSFCGKTTLGQLGALYSLCRLLISNDTGPLHIGAGVGTNVVGLFGPTQPLETAPLGRGRNILIQYAPEGVKLPWIGTHFPAPWMELITVDQVFRVIEQEQLLADIRVSL